jgi:hypothetical protein
MQMFANGFGIKKSVSVSLYRFLVSMHNSRYEHRKTIGRNLPQYEIQDGIPSS